MALPKQLPLGVQEHHDHLCDHAWYIVVMDPQPVHTRLKIETWCDFQFAHRPTHVLWGGGQSHYWFKELAEAHIFWITWG